MENSATNACPRCGASFGGVQVEGLCARCLGVLNFSPDTMFSENAAGDFADFSPEDLEESFPQLEILELLGRGGMGIVYKARQKQLGRVVALKLLPLERVADPQFADRFRREAQALASLNHPNIVAIHDFGQTNGLYYLLMEFVDGVNLRQAMNAGRFTPAQALAIVPPVCDALQFAHEHGIVHRDIKPENLLLDKRGHVKIADFGIAKMLGQEAANSDVAESQPAGTPQYMAPEQQQPGETDHRADIYSLGVVLYEMLTGELPESRLQPPSRRIQIDVRIDQIVLRALEKTPEMRFATAEEFRTSVETITREDGNQHTHNTKPISISRLALWGAVCAAICLISLPLLDMAWIGGGLASTLLGWMAILEIQRSEGRVRGLKLAVFDALLFPLLTVNAMVVAAYAKFIVPIRNPPYPTMVNPSWPFIVVGLNLLTLFFIVLLNFLIVRAVWRHLNKSTSAGDTSSTLVSWPVVAGTFLVLGGAILLLGAPVINELIDDFALTKTARYYQQEHKRVSQQWSHFNAVAAEAAVALDIAKKAQNAEEIARLTQETESLRQRAAQAESAVNRVALYKEVSERQRLAVFYLIGGGLIVGGLFVCYRKGRRSNMARPDHDAVALMTGTATLVTREELASAWTQSFCYRTRGPLVLDEQTLTHTYAGGTTSIPLKAIRDVSIGRLPRLMNFTGLNALSISYEDEGETRQVLVSPIEGWLQFSQQAVADWFAAIRKAVVVATGRKPSTRPPEQLGIPPSSRLLFFFLLIVPTLCLLALFMKLADESRRTANVSPVEQRVAGMHDPAPTFLKRPEDARVNMASSPKFDDRVFVYCAEPISGAIVDHHLSAGEVILNVGVREGVRFGHAFQIQTTDSKEHVGVAKVVELEATGCVAKVVSVNQNFAETSLTGMPAICTAPPAEEGQDEIKKHFDKDIWQTESLENKLIRELLQSHGSGTRILILHQ